MFRRAAPRRLGHRAFRDCDDDRHTHGPDKDDEHRDLAYLMHAWKAFALLDAPADKTHRDLDDLDDLYVRSDTLGGARPDGDTRLPEWKKMTMYDDDHDGTHRESLQSYVPLVYRGVFYYDMGHESERWQLHHRHDRARRLYRDKALSAQSR